MKVTLCTMDTINRKFIRCVKTNNLSKVVALLKSGADVHTQDSCALKWSAECGYLDIVVKLLDYGADMHCNNDYALRWSARNNHLDVVKLLLERGANINAGTGTGIKTALAYSTEYDHLDVVTALLGLGANVCAHNNYALWLSVRLKRYKIMEKLLESGADVRCNDRQILKELRENFDEQTADIILPYCSTDDWEYFPSAYIKAKIVPTKNANIKKK